MFDPTNFGASAEFSSAGIELWMSLLFGQVFGCKILQVFAILIWSEPIPSIQYSCALTLWCIYIYYVVYGCILGNRMDMSFVAWLRLFCISNVQECNHWWDGAGSVFWPAPLNQPAVNSELQRLSCLYYVDWRIPMALLLSCSITLIWFECGDNMITFKFHC